MQENNNNRKKELLEKNMHTSFIGYGFSSQEIEYYTPVYIIKKVQQVLGKIDLDPASCEVANKTVQAAKIYTREENGLDKHWYGKVYLNPPYGKTKNESNAGIWSSKLIAEYQAGSVEEAILLVNAALSYKWFKTLYEYPMCFPYDRLDFSHNAELKAKKHAQNNAIVYIGENEGKFREVFQEIGCVMKSVEKIAV